MLFAFLRSWLLRFFAVMGVLLCLGSITNAYATAHANEPSGQPVAGICAPQLQGSWAAQEVQAGMRPSEGWQPVQLPHTTSALWPRWTGPVWYRIDWRLDCTQSGQARPDSPQSAQPQDLRETALALAISGVRLAGTVYWNDELLWSDRSLAEPFSRSWNMPRWWPVSIHDRSAVQTAWVRVVAAQNSFMGVGYVQLDDAAAIQDAYETRYWRQRTGYVVTAGLSLAISCIALVVWLWRRSEPVYLWMGLMQACWTLYLGVVLSTDPWPWLSSKDLSILNLVSFMLYGQCFLIFILRFSGQRRPWLERVSWTALGLWIVLMPAAESVLPGVGEWSLVWGVVLFTGACWYMAYRAWCTREPQHVLLAVCCLVMSVVGLHDIVVALRAWDNDQTWSAFSWLVQMLVLAVLLGWQVASHMRRVDRFNVELTEHVAQARAELSQVMEQQHAQALQNAKLQERVQLAHDLHDGLGGSLVRSMALVEQAPQQLSNERVMSLLKVLRDDLRQVIDSGSSTGVSVAETPVLWMAPLRHRFTQLLDELGLSAEWQIDAQWQTRPSPLQCMGLVRFLEEAFANVIKHSRASRVRVQCHQPNVQTLVLSVEDNGVGFDVAMVEAASVGVGMRSMQARVQRIGGRLQVSSSPGRTILSASVAVQA